MGRKAKQWGVVLVGLVVLLGGYVVAGPYVAIQHLREQALGNKAYAMSWYIDEDAVRASLRQQMIAGLAAQGPNPRPGSGAAIVAAMSQTEVAALLDRAVDAYLAPEGMLQLMNGFTRPRWGAHPVAAAAPWVGMDYVSTERFEVNIEGPAPQGQKIKFVLRRKGLFWKLVDIRMPPVKPVSH